MFGFGFKIHADTKEVDWAERKLDRFAEHFEHHFSRHFSKMFGAGALAAGAISVLEGIFGKPEEIEKLSKKFKLTTDEVQLLQEVGKDMGLTFEEVLERIKKGTIDITKAMEEMRKKKGIGISSADVKDLSEASAQLKKAREEVERIAILGAAKALRGVDEVAKMVANKGAIQFLAQTNHISEAEAAKIYYKTNPNMLPGGSFVPGPAGQTPGSGDAQAEFEAWMKAHPERPSNSFASDKNDNWNAFNRERNGKASSGLEKLKRIGQINQQILSLQRREHEVEANKLPPNELIQPGLTSRQQAGAYSSQQGILATKIDDTNFALKEIQDEIKRLEDTVKELQD